MKRTFFTVFVLLMLTALLSAQTVNVTFRANVAAVPDTLGATSLVQIRGTSDSDDGNIDVLSPGVEIAWNANTTMYLQNVGGDYWEGTFAVPAGSALKYKFFTNYHSTVASGDEWEHTGWENDVAETADPIVGGEAKTTNRVLDLSGFAGTDTVLNLQFVNGWSMQKPGQYATPYTTNDSTFVIYIRTNMMGFEEFDPSRHAVGVRGSNMEDWGQTGELSWGPSYLLTKGPGDGKVATNFYSAAIHVPLKYDSAGVKFKLVVHDTVSGSIDEDWSLMFHNSGREDEVPFVWTGEDTTVHWFWFDNMAPIIRPNEDSVIVTFKADMSKAISDNAFSSNDTVVVKSGWNATADNVYTSGKMIRQGISSIYAIVDTVVSSLNEDLQYSYYLVKNGQEFKEIFFDFADSDGGSSAERRKLLMTGSTVLVEDYTDDIASPRRKPTFRNTTPIDKDITVIYTCDVRPAFYQVKFGGSTLEDIQSTFHITDPEDVITYGVRINGPATGSWETWGQTLYDNAERTMYDDGTNGDEVAGDSIYTATFTYLTSTVPVPTVGQEFKFGIHGGDNEGGFGNNHIENIDMSGDTTFIHSQFGSIDPLFYSEWDYTNQMPSAIGDDDLGTLPKVYTLNQNYPNPFNPVTTITYTLAKSGKVKLDIYNVLGQKVRTLIDGNATAGLHVDQWNGLDNNGKKVASGVYFYKLEAGEFTAIKKMIMIK
ncbi:MAG: T9SS type A sorting domain-containing protein [Calditrichaceae bacterium]